MLEALSSGREHRAFNGSACSVEMNFDDLLHHLLFNQPVYVCRAVLRPDLAK